MDRIIINDMVFYGYHGVLPEENKLGQKFTVHAQLMLNLAAAGRSDELKQSVSYADVFTICKNVVENRVFKLLETLAETISEQILMQHKLVEQCTVQVVKENPPIPGHFGSAAVEVTRKQLKYTAYLSLGTNIGEREQFLRDAIFKLNTHPEIRVLRQSSVYETDPVGFTEQATFLNTVVQVETALLAEELLAYGQEIERQLGRERTIRWGPRTIDVDILLYEQMVIQTEDLVVPHPRMHERSFVLVPLSELEPELILPRRQQTITDMIAELPDRESVRIWNEDLM